LTELRFDLTQIRKREEEHLSQLLSSGAVVHLFLFYPLQRIPWKSDQLFHHASSGYFSRSAHPRR
jgi:hypothetical protein